MNRRSEQGHLHTVTDDKDYIHQLTEKLGQGGQGAVFRTTDQNVVVKTLVDGMTGNIIKDKARYESFKDDIDEVRILKLPENIHVAKPVHLLKEPNCGYIMRLLSDMVPIRKLILPKEKELIVFYTETGGLRRRLQLLTETAKILSRLHSLPVVYADISPENIFVSLDVEAKEVWLIDSDNMRYIVDFQNSIFTPGYGAPEIVKGMSGNNTLSDIYSFALLAFETLALIAPFEGDLVMNGGGWDDEEQDYGAKAERGELPWIEDAEDDSNYSDFGIPRRIVLSGKMQRLFQQTFGKAGREDPTARPSMKVWYEVLRQASDVTLTCTNCGATFYINHNSCPFCNWTREKVCLAQVSDRYLLPEEDGSEIEHYEKGLMKIFDIKDSNAPQYLYSYHTGDVLLDDTIENTVELEFGKVMKIRNLTTIEMALVHDGRLEPLLPNRMQGVVDPNHATLLIPISEHRTRQISFRII